MEWLIVFILNILSSIFNAIKQYHKASKEDLGKTVTTTASKKSDLTILEEYGISYKLRKAVNILRNETKSLSAATYAKKIASNCFGSPSPKIKSKDPFGSIEDIPETPFYTYLPVPFSPQSNLFLYVAGNATRVRGLFYDTGIDLPTNNSGVVIDEVGNAHTGRIFVLCQFTGSTIKCIQSTDIIKLLSSQIQFFWSGLLQNEDKGGWIAFSNQVIEEPYYRTQEALNYLMTLIAYYGETDNFYVYNGKKFYSLVNGFADRIAAWWIYKGFFCITAPAGTYNGIYDHEVTI